MKQTLKLVYLTWPDCNDVMRNAYLITFVYVLCALPVICVTTGKFSQNGKFGQNGKLGHSCTNVTKGKLYGSQDSDHAIAHLVLNVSSFAHNCGCVVDGGNAMAAI